MPSPAHPPRHHLQVQPAGQCMLGLGPERRLMLLRAFMQTDIHTPVAPEGRREWWGKDRNAVGVERRKSADWEQQMWEQQAVSSNVEAVEWER